MTLLVAHRRLIGIALTAFVLFTPSCASTWVDEPQDDPAGELESVMEDWEAAREDGRSGEVERVRLEQLLSKYPRNVPMLFNAAVLAHDAGDRMRARGHLDMILDLDARHASAAALRARLALADGNLPLADRLVEEQIMLNPDAAVLYEVRSAVAFMKDDKQLAMDSLERAERLGAPSWRVSYHRGLIAERDGRHEEAIGHYRSALGEQEHAASRSRLRALEASR